MVEAELDLRAKNAELAEVNRKQQALAELKTEYDGLKPDISLIAAKLVIFGNIWDSVSTQVKEFGAILETGMSSLTNEVCFTPHAVILTIVLTGDVGVPLAGYLGQEDLPSSPQRSCQLRRQSRQLAPSQVVNAYINRTRVQYSVVKVAELECVKCVDPLRLNSVSEMKILKVKTSITIEHITMARRRRPPSLQRRSFREE
jgi:hypothetical protein